MDLNPILQPEFFDIFGLVCFSYISGLSVLALRGKSLPKWSYAVLLAIGVAGLLVDGTIVFVSYFR